MNGEPWVEKYRPDNIDNIILDPINKRIFQNIVAKKILPNLLLYGPPGTGKTTTIINLVDAVQEKKTNKQLVMHLNASDDRGIDTVRNQITQFVNAKYLFTKGVKVVILDEVDYMTKNAQIALKNLISKYNSHTRFCLICNYINKIDDSLQNIFIRFRFHELPRVSILKYIDNININECLNLSHKSLNSIIDNFGSDIRSIINYMQTNVVAKNILDEPVIFTKIIHYVLESSTKAIKYLSQITRKYKIEIFQLIKQFFNYTIRIYQFTGQYLKFVEFIIHQYGNGTVFICEYFVNKLALCIKLKYLIVEI